MSKKERRPTTIYYVIRSSQIHPGIINPFWVAEFDMTTGKFKGYYPQRRSQIKLRARFAEVFGDKRELGEEFQGYKVIHMGFPFQGVTEAYLRNFIDGIHNSDKYMGA